MSQSGYKRVNDDIVEVIRDQYKTCGTRYFGLGNLNKMKQLNDGGKEISRRISDDPYLKDKNIRIWTGDTLTAASVYNQVMAIPDLDKVFYIGANGKIGKAVCELLVKKNIHVCIFSSFVGFTHPNVKYTQNLSDMLSYKHVLIGKMLDPKIYHQALSLYRNSTNEASPDLSNRVLLDYTVPFMPLSLGKGFQHVQVGVLTVNQKGGKDRLLKGHFDVCMGTDENQIYPCHAGCILNMVEKRESDETGDIDVDEMDRLWTIALSRGLANKEIPSPSV